MNSSTSYTVRKRLRQTRWSVYLVDRAARWLIAAGGIGTILAVLTVCIFLVWVVVPLFAPGVVHSRIDTAWNEVAPLHVAVDERQILGRAVLTDGRLALLRAETGEVLETREFLAGQSLTAASFSNDGQDAAFGFADGSVRLGRLTFSTSFAAPSDLPESVRALPIGEIARNGKKLVMRTAAEQFRVTGLVDQLDDTPLVEGDRRSAVDRLDFTRSAHGKIGCVLTADGHLALYVVSKRDRRATADRQSPEKGTPDVRKVDLPLDVPADKGLPQFVLVSSLGDDVYVAWSDGDLIRYNTRDLEHPRVAERRSIVRPGETLTALTFMLGRATLAAGYSNGTIRGWFCIKPQGAESFDGALLVAGHELAGPAVAVTSLASSARTRMLAAGYSDGRVRVFCMTNERLVVETGVPRSRETLSDAGSASGLDSVRHLADVVAMAPRDDGLLRCTNRRLVQWQLDARYPEVSLGALFLPVWYEGYERPAWVWQSSSGSDEFEPKLGLMPLVFGTLKATLYTMLFGVPLALCAAIYTSEFLAPRAKAKIKPAIEMMASLPSVVLGFLAGLVIAPLVEGVVPSILISFFTVPLTFLMGAYVWQLLPPKWTVRWARWRFVLIIAMLPIGILLAAALGPKMERLLFAGDLRAWLDGRVGTGTGGWLLLLIPLCAVGIGWLVTERLNPWLRRTSRHWSREARALADLFKFFMGAAVTLAVAWLLATLLTWLGFDPRGSLIGTYVQRNALVVGFVMGFAVIPIIYTIADDALSSVPEHLRSASLGAGATRWQTATRIIIPTAMSGLFSAVMIGLGRAVGETMIVLMAAGNTPIMDWNIFSGFQTLSALIATELPEAVRNSSHYRTLFLAALTLFLLTFLLNTVAEVIRLRFRRRAYEL